MDNRRCNLRLCNNSQNSGNSIKQKNYNGKRTTSKHKGVYWHKEKNKWLVRIGFNNKRIHLGYFKNEIDAAKAYNQRASKLFGEFAKLNKVGE